MGRADYYQLLEIQKTATTEEVKKAYRKKAMQYHPDRNPGNKEAEDKFKEAAEAYDVLGNPEKRARYDKFGHDGVSGGGGFGNVDFDLGTIFERFGDLFNGGFGGGFSNFDSFFGGGGQKRSRVRQGSNLRITVKLSLEEIVKGCEKKIKIQKYVACPKCKGVGTTSKDSVETCPTCHGSGQEIRVERSMFGVFQQATVCGTCQGKGEIIKDPCPDCNGNGVVKGAEVVTINIPQGVVSGMQLTLQGKGNAALNGGINGDLFVVIEELEHPIFEREENNIYLNYYISFPQAALGATVEIPTLEGKTKIKIEPGTQGGQILRIQGKGIPDIRRQNGRGDLIVNILVWTPKTLSKEEKELIEKFNHSEHFIPKPNTNDKKFFSKIRAFFNK